MNVIKNTLAASLAVGLLASAFPVSAETNLIHRWSFNEVSGTTVADSIGSADGTLRQLISNSIPQGTLPTLDGTEVMLDGDAGYVDLPNGIFSGLSNVTIEIWFRYLDDTENWVNLLCAGAINNNANASENALEDTGAGTDSLRDTFTGGQYWGADGLFITPMNGATGNGRFAISDDTNATFNFERPQLDSLDPLFNDPDLGGFPNYLAVTYGPNGQRLFVFNDEQVSSTIDSNDYVDLGAINDINVWLGRSMYGGDPMLGATINELRIHDTILTSAEISASYFTGATDPNLVGYDPGSLNSLTPNVNPNMLEGQTQHAQVTANYSNLGNIPIYPPDLDLATVDNTNVLSVVDSDLVALSAGTATFTVALDGITNSVVITVAPTAAELKHRYSFNDSPGSSTVIDSVGGADGTVVASSTTNVTLTGTEADFPGGGFATVPHIDLPDGIMSARTNVTIEGWFTWRGPAGSWWQRVFTFGASSKTAGSPTNNGAGIQWLFLTPHADTGMRFAGNPGGGETTITSGSVTSVDVEHHFAVVYAPELPVARLYVDGVQVASATTPVAALAGFTDTNNWLGVSQWPDDGLNGSINEFRIHEGVMSPLDVQLSIAAGPDTLPVAPGALLSVTVESEDIMIGNPNLTQAYLYGTFENVSNVNLLADGGSLESSDTDVITVDANGFLTAVGTNGQFSTISGTYFSESVTPQVVNILGPTNLAMTLTGPLTAGDLSASAGLVADFDSATLQNQDVSGFNDIVWVSSNPSAASVAAGLVTPNGPGVAEIVATYGGLSATSVVSVTVDPGRTPATLLHRYSFGEAADATNAVDSIGGADAEVRGILPGNSTDNFNGSGQLLMSGGGSSAAPASAYVNLPNGLISGLDSVTMEGWLTWSNGTGGWERWFDFGMSSGNQDTNTLIWAEDAHLNPGRSYMFLSQVGADDEIRFAIKEGTGAETGANESPVTGGMYYHYAVVYDPTDQGVASIYLNGQRVAETATSLSLSVVDDRNNWLGRSQWTDGMLNAAYDEFRIWDGTLLGADIEAAYAAGPNTVITPIVPSAPPELIITEALPNVIVSWDTNATGFLLEAAPDVTGTYSTNGLPAPSVVGGEFQVTVPATNESRYFRLTD